MLTPRQRRPPRNTMEQTAAALACQEDLSPADLEAFYLRCTGGSAVFVLEAPDGASGGTDLEVLARLFGSPAGRALVKAAPAPAQPRRWVAAAAAAAAAAEAAERRGQAEAAAAAAAAAALLGPPCSLSDSCRCIECQSHYLDCGDDDGAGMPQLCALQ